jgi:hypothetical protein
MYANFESLGLEDGLKDKPIDCIDPIPQNARTQTTIIVMSRALENFFYDIGFPNARGCTPEKMVEMLQKQYSPENYSYSVDDILWKHFGPMIRYYEVEPKTVVRDGIPMRLNFRPYNFTFQDLFDFILQDNINRILHLDYEPAEKSFL